MYFELLEIENNYLNNKFSSILNDKKLY